MKFEGLCAKASHECGYVGDADCVRIYVAAASDNPVLTRTLEAFRLESAGYGLDARIIAVGSWGLYELEPLVLTQKPGHKDIIFPSVTPEVASEIFSSYIKQGILRPELALCCSGGKSTGVPGCAEIPLFALQERIALRNCGRIDPDSISEYIVRAEGYKGLAQALEKGPIETTAWLGRSRFGGDNNNVIPVAQKWKACLDAGKGKKYLICNAIDADPASRAASLLLESDPHSVLEGMLIAAFAAGATHGYICLDSRNQAQIARLHSALQQMKAYSLIGDNILDTDFSFEVEIKGIPSSLVIDVETALLRFLENKPAMPYALSRHATTRTLNGKPALLHSAETLSRVSALYQQTPECHSTAEKSRDLRIITLFGDVAHKYTVELPSNTRLRTLLNDIGGGIQGGRPLKAVQVGGPAGLLLSPDDLDTTLDDRKIEGAKGEIWSGAVRFFAEQKCGVKLVGEIISELQVQSCGKCVFCREGSYQMVQILNDLIEYKARPDDLNRLAEFGEAMKTGSICDLGRAAPSPVLSGLRLFRADFESHLKEKRCLESSSAGSTRD